jgi:hypothetical protein
LSAVIGASALITFLRDEPRAEAGLLRIPTSATGIPTTAAARKAQEYFKRILKGRVWITWGFIEAETKLLREVH